MCGCSVWVVAEPSHTPGWTLDPHWPHWTHPLDRLYLSRYVQVRVKNKHGRLGYYRWKHKSTSSSRSGRQWRTHGAQIESPSSTGAEDASTAAPASSCLMASKTGNKASHSFSMAREWAMRMLA